MQIRFTKMQGAGNDFVVLDETRGLLGLSGAQYRFLADRHFGVGADQILTVRPSPGEGIDFEYVIHNADGGEVEQCGNGARCFARFVHDKGFTGKDTIRVLRRRIFKKDGRVVLPDRTPNAAQSHADLSQLEAGDAVEAIYEGWGLPSEQHHFSFHPDEYNVLRVLGAMNPSSLDFNPQYFHNPPVYYYLCGGAYAVARLAGLLPPLDRSSLHTDPAGVAAFYRCGRLLSVACAVATVLLPDS